MRSRPQPPLIEFAHLRIFGHDPIGEIHHIAQVERRVRQGLGREQIFDAQFGLFGTQGPQPHDPHIVDVTHQKYRRQAGHVDMTGLLVLLGQAGKRRAGGPAVKDQVAAPLRNPPLNFGSESPACARHSRIIALLQQSPAVDRHQLRQLRMHARAVQALVVVFPEYFPIALHGLVQHMADDQFLQRPGIEPIQRQIENLLEGRRLVGQRDEHEAAPLLDADLVQRIVGDVEAAGMGLGGSAQQIPLQIVNPGMVRTDDGAGTQRTFGFAAQGRAAMPAGIVKTLQRALIVAHQEQLLIAEFEGLKGARLRQAAGSAHVHPVAVPDRAAAPSDTGEDRSRRPPAGPGYAPSGRCSPVHRLSGASSMGII